ncbi:MAG: hypothetical protein KC432_15150 [Thermomicrobiales bacterium]|nr:hypothetical protein [Thermomicrobiales bacterium]
MAIGEGFAAPATMAGAERSQRMPPPSPALAGLLVSWQPASVMRGGPGGGAAARSAARSSLPAQRVRAGSPVQRERNQGDARHSAANPLGVASVQEL